MYVAFTGARYWTDPEPIIRELEKLPKDAVILHGGQGGWRNGILTGADSIVDYYAKEMGFEVRVFPADWSKYHKGAGPKRNGTMVQELNKARKEGHETQLIAIHDNLDASKGTANMVRQTRLACHRIVLCEG